MKWVTATALTLVVLVSCAGAAARSAPRPWRLVIATGGRGAVYYAYGTGIARLAGEHLPGADPRVIATAASVENLRLIGQGRADAAFTLADSAALAVEGACPFTAREPVVALARLYDNYTHLVVAANSRIRTLTDLKGRVVSTGADGSGTELIADRLLGVAGLDVNRDIRRRRYLAERSAAALRAGRIDAFFFSGGLPTGAISALARAMPIRLIDLDAYVEPLRTRFGEIYQERTIPASAYGLGREVRTVGVPNYLVVNSAMPTDHAYALTRLLFTQRDALAEVHPEALHLDRRAAISTDPVPLHPGAIRYYRESKPEI